MINKIWQIPINAENYPFQAADRRCHLEELGYVEEEYFMSGTANVYTEKGHDHEVEVLCPDAPYTTRLLIRRPVQRERFSGNVVIEILNASAMMDIDRMWVNTWKYLTRNGDIYIGITSKGHTIDTMKRFNPKRYALLNWDNPMPEREKPENTGTFQFLPQYESGLYWDMQTDLARLLRTEDTLNPIREYGKCYLYLLGWSQSGSYMSRTVTSFAKDAPDGTPLFDGYLEAGADAALAPINAYEIASSNGAIFQNGTLPKGSTLLCREPYIAINTESENRGANWMGDLDRPEAKFRTYQIPGSSHDAWYNMEEYYEGYLQEDATKYNCALHFSGKEGEPMDTPYHCIFAAALRNLYVWVREGVPAPHAPKIDTIVAGDKDFDPFSVMWEGPVMKYANRKDVFGNSTGGIRMACLDYPVARYQSYSVREDGSFDPMYGSVYPFPVEQLRQMYGSLAHYRELVEKSAAETVALGFLLKEDVAEYVEYTVDQAKRRGLL